MSVTTETKTKKKVLKSNAAATKAKPVTKAATHPPFADIIKECIAETGDRAGVSRPTIKKFIEEKYKMEVTPTVISNINRCIASGAEKGTFVLPKGPSGKVKLAPKKASSDAAKENAKPVKTPAPTKADKKPATKSVPLKAKAPAKKAVAKPAKKASATTTKPAKAVIKKPSSKQRLTYLQALTGTAKSKPSKAKSSPKKDKAESTGSSKRKSASITKASSSVKAAKPVSTK